MEVSAKQKTNKLERFISTVEKIGNKLPHPFWLFIALSVIVMVLSFVMAKMGVSVNYMSAARESGAAPTETLVTITNLLSKESLQDFFGNLVSNYSGFAPLGATIVIMFAVGVLEKSGMLDALIRRTIIKTPPSLIIAVIAFIGTNSGITGDAGTIMIPALSGAIMKSIGLNPWIGVIAGYAAANGGFHATMLITGNDVLLSGVTKSVTDGLGINYSTHPLMNWYFMAAASIVIIICTVLVSQFFTKKYLGEDKVEIDKADINNSQLTDAEKRGLRWSGIAFIAYIALILILTIPSNGLFRNADGTLLPQSPLMNSILSILFFLFFILAIVYGKASGSVKSLQDIPGLMQEGFSGAIGFMVIALPASVFINLFNASNISTVLGVHLGNLFTSINLGGFAAILVLILVSTCFNIFITSGVTKWLIFSPVFIPLFASLGMSPALTQATYRIADMSTNIISPIDYYVPVIMGLLATYKSKNEKREVGIGTVISLCLPYSIAFLVGMTLLMFIWHLFGLPIGPGAPMFL
ncbi:AbgT family transporter [Irregularibacter muris]|uniref:AbgT family transporter n=1 Tax=Irregularibacter muris TaxID=1796619 RepID=A0AAE3HF39_9FIRM|nr:AbgT family transporter [Irregularibacter muris]MCR1897398.1 AbgT family transporter [Irregularibacter muris]